MPYIPTVWTNNQPPPLSAANLNKLTDELKTQASTHGVTNTLPTWVNDAAPALSDPIPLNEIERVTKALSTAVGLSYTQTVWSAGWTPTRNAARFNALETQLVAISNAGAGTLGVDRATMLATGGTILREDTSAQADPLTGLWGELSNNTPTRHVHRTTGGDSRPKADGTAQGNTAYRELTIVPGDSWQGETAQRIELGRNTTTPYYTECQPGSTAGTFALCDQGQHRIHFWSQRYHDNYIMTQNNWQLIMQNKQNQPYGANGPVDTAPALAISLYGGNLHLENFWSIIWTTPAPVKNVWIRYALEAYYSQDALEGWVRLYVDNDGDGDFLDADEMSPQITCPTLATITVKGNSPRNVGDPLPSHMRLGIYRQQTYLTTSVQDQDNVQVMG